MTFDDVSAPVLVGTSNAGKLSEICRYADRLGFRAIGLNDPLVSHRRPSPVVAEVSGTFMGNAELKARAYAAWADRPCIADDTGIEFSLLGGLPGPYTSEWGLGRVISALGQHSKAAARFVCCMTYSEPSGRTVTVRSELEGELRGFTTWSGAGESPLPFARFFYPVGESLPLSSLTEQGYDGSHRFIALKMLVNALS